MTNFPQKSEPLHNKGLTDSQLDYEDGSRITTPDHSDSKAIATNSQPEMSEESFRRGYLQGRTEQQHIQAQRQRNKRYETSGKGLVLGIGIISLLLIGLGLIFIPEWIGEEPSDTIIDEPNVEMEVE